ncbi:MAG TPA: FHA domain-containing protein [Polyangia bacterium]
MEDERPFALLVSLVGGKPARYVFDQDRILVGRGLEADLRIEHAAISRSQFLLERGRGSAGEPRYRITPYESVNVTHVNERPAVEGTLTPGDVVAIADVRVVLERKLPKASRAVADKNQISPLRAVLLGAVTLMALWVGWLLFAGPDQADAGDLARAQTQMFLPMNEVRCGNPVECDNRAHDAYARGKSLVAQAGADPGNLYRAAIELDRAARFRDQSGRPLADMADVSAQADQARARAESEFQDARFRLSRAIASGDLRRQAAEAALLARILPDDHHPYRIKLDAYRRTLPKPAVPGPGETK